MKNKGLKLFAAWVAWLSSLSLSAQSFLPIASYPSVSLRGLSVVSDQVIWASGNKGRVAKSTDSGKHWRWMVVDGYQNSDFRDIEAADSLHALIMAVQAPAVILKTNDGGISWKEVMRDTSAGTFLDAMDFFDAKAGWVVGDPTKHHFYVAETQNGGETWQKIGDATSFNAEAGEACFASSGTNLVAISAHRFCIVTGGTRSRFLHSGSTAVALPLAEGKETAGANALALRFFSKTRFWAIAVGGDFTVPYVKEGNCALSNDNGATWSKPLKGPNGYRSCVEIIDATSAVCCGTSGVDISIDRGQSWKPISTEGFNVCKKAKAGHHIFLAGSDGRIARLENLPR